MTADEVASWAGEPLTLFIGISTSGSVAHAVFHRWAAELGQPWALRGVDLPAGAPPDAFRPLVSAMRRNPAVDGSVVTAHKLRLYRACGRDLARRDWLTEITHEINALGEAVRGIRPRPAPHRPGPLARQPPRPLARLPLHFTPAPWTTVEFRTTSTRLMTCP
jgi:hypothetical protein